MDGNGRWAQSRGHRRSYGHIRGATRAKNVIENCVELGIPYLTLYAFSTENWMRPKQEVFLLMQLLARHLSKERRNLVAQNIKFSTIGDISRMPAFVKSEIELTKSVTKNNTGMELTFALSYGGRQEITAACRQLVAEAARGELSVEDISEDLVNSRLETKNIPDPDLIIRTRGEYRLSNFMLWQAAYSELYVTEIAWPDFEKTHLLQAIAFDNWRERRFGRVKETAPESQLEHSQSL